MGPPMRNCASVLCGAPLKKRCTASGTRTASAQLLISEDQVFSISLTTASGIAFVALGANARRPFDRGAGADLGLPFGVRLRQIIGEVEGGARTVGAAHHGDGITRQLQLRIELGDRRVVPLLDLAEIDVAE